MKMDPEKLLGGYATGTLTEEERKALFEAALQNQTLFDALADEQAFKELVEDPISRRQVLASLEPHRRSAGARFGEWLRRRAPLAMAGALAAGVVIVAVVRTIPPTPPAARPGTPPAAREIRASAPRPVEAQPAPVAAAPRPAKTRAAMRRPEVPAAKPAEEPVEQARSAAAPPAPAREQDFATARPSGAGGFVAQPRISAARQLALAPAQAVRYTLLYMGEEVDPNTAFGAGESVEVRLEPVMDGYLSVTTPADGEWKTLFQSHVQPGTPYLVPVRLEEPARDRKLRVVFSRTPQPSDSRAEFEITIRSR